MARKRNPRFVVTAALAAVAGFGTIGASIGWPLYQRLQGAHPDPVLVVCGTWAFLVLMVSAATIYVCLRRGSPPRRPPRGGEKVVYLCLLETTHTAFPPVEGEREAA